MNRPPTPLLFLSGLLLVAACGPAAGPPGLAEQAPNTWVQRSPLPSGPPSPQLGYEASLGYDPRARVLIR
jgi:hypothetical protein